MESQPLTPVVRPTTTTARGLLQTPKEGNVDFGREKGCDVCRYERSIASPMCRVSGALTAASSRAPEKVDPDRLAFVPVRALEELDPYYFEDVQEQYQSAELDSGRNGWLAFR